MPLAWVFFGPETIARLVIGPCAPLIQVQRAGPASSKRKVLAKDLQEVIGRRGNGVVTPHDLVPTKDVNQNSVAPIFRGPCPYSYLLHPNAM
ncbi:hypothetical protein F4782DRAFT_482525 [Xylaria castorea]|nr:hypothetical protein F4782DRAFT_482525 [Xylaria castorea]